jgi:hypothetical protein
MAPFTAHADSSSPQTHSATAASSALSHALTGANHTFSSPASHSVPAVGSHVRSAEQPNTSAMTLSLAGKTTSAYGVQVTSNVAQATAGVVLTATVAWGDGTTSTAQGTAASDGTAAIDSTHTYAKTGAYRVSVTVSDGTDSVSNYVDGYTSGTSYTAYGPTRLLDTRYGTGAPKAKVPSHGVVKLKIAGNGAIPDGVGAAVLNLTVTNALKSGFITAYPDGYDRPTASNVNFTAGQTAANLGLVPVGGDGYIDLYNSSGSTVDLIADINGYFGLTSASYYQPLTPFRLADTRYGTGTPKAQLAPHTSIALTVAGAGHGLPTSGVSAVALNMTVTNTKSSGVLTVYPDGVATPTASNLNFVSGQTIANATVTPVGSDGKIRVYLNSGQAADVIVDVVGYYSTSAKAAFVPYVPSRLVDTRDPNDPTYGPLTPDSYVYLGMTAGQPDIPGLVLNTTVANTKGNGWLGIAPDPNTMAAYDNDTAVWPPAPTSSTLNWTHGQVVPNLAQVSTGANGIVDLWNRSTGDTDLIVDMFGLYQTD